MAIKSLAKVDSLARDLAEKLVLRSANSASGRVNTVRAARDSAGNPVIFLSRGANEAAGQPVLFIRFSQIDMVSKDIFGNDALAYAPHNCEVAYELTAAGKQTPSQLDLAILLRELAVIGIKLQIKEIANATAVTAAAADAAAVAQEIDWLYWPTKGA